MAHRVKEIPNRQKQAQQVAPPAAKVAPHATNTSQQLFPRFLPCCSDLVPVGIYFTILRFIKKNKKV
jgi:hypothetical protein